jgi:hypothetical protein
MLVIEIDLACDPFTPKMKHYLFLLSRFEAVVKAVLPAARAAGLSVYPPFTGASKAKV